MTAPENPASERMADAAPQRPDPAREPGRTAILWGSRTRPPVLTWPSMRPARIR